jgi:hypothetical protein
VSKEPPSIIHEKYLKKKIVYSTRKVFTHPLPLKRMEWEELRSVGAGTPINIAGLNSDGSHTETRIRRREIHICHNR